MKYEDLVETAMQMILFAGDARDDIKHALDAMMNDDEAEAQKYMESLSGCFFVSLLLLADVFFRVCGAVEFCFGRFAPSPPLRFGQILPTVPRHSFAPFFQKNCACLLCRKTKNTRLAGVLCFAR